jgi:hypothetical protein
MPPNAGRVELLAVLPEIEKSWDAINIEMFEWFFRMTKNASLWAYFIINDSYPCAYFEEVMAKTTYQVHHLDHLIQKARRKFVDFYIFARVYNNTKLRQQKICKNSTNTKADIDFMFNRFQLLVFYYILFKKDLYTIETDEESRLTDDELQDAINEEMQKNNVRAYDMTQFFYCFKYISRSYYSKSQKRLCMSTSLLTKKEESEEPEESEESEKSVDTEEERERDLDAFYRDGEDPVVATESLDY